MKKSELSKTFTKAANVLACAVLTAFMLQSSNTPVQYLEKPNNEVTQRSLEPAFTPGSQKDPLLRKRRA